MNLSILRETSLPDLLFRESIFLKSCSEGIFAAAGVELLKQRAAGQRGASDGMVEGLGLGLGRWGGSQSCLRLSGRGGAAEQLSFLGDGLSQVTDGFADVGRVVVGFVGVLRAAMARQSEYQA